MIMYISVLVAIILSIFGFSYSQLSTPLIQLAEAQVEGANETLERSSLESLEIISQDMEGEANREQECKMHDDDRYRLETIRIIEQKLMDAKQIGLPEDLWPQDLKNDAAILKNLLDKKNGFDTSGLTQNIQTTLNIALEDEAKKQGAVSASSTHEEEN